MDFWTSKLADADDKCVNNYFKYPIIRWEVALTQTSLSSINVHLYAEKGFYVQCVVFLCVWFFFLIDAEMQPISHSRVDFNKVQMLRSETAGSRDERGDSQRCSVRHN